MDIPITFRDLIDKAECIIVFPSVLKAAFVIGGSYGRGAMTAVVASISPGHGALHDDGTGQAAALAYSSAAKPQISSCWS